jgi:hypothetical protein
MKLRKLGGYLAATLAMAMATDAHAQSFIVCYVKVVAVGTTPDGAVFASFDVSGTTVQWWLCSTTGTTTVNTAPTSSVAIPSSACQATLAQLMTIRASGGQAILTFSGPTACTAAALPASQTVPNPYPSQLIF